MLTATTIASEDAIPSPGSNEAMRQGCLCPQAENHYGKGYMGGAKDSAGNTMFVYNNHCPLHGEGPSDFDYYPPEEE